MHRCARLLLWPSQTPKRPEALVSQVLSPGVTVKAICPLAPDDLPPYGLEPGQFTKPWWAT